MKMKKRSIYGVLIALLASVIMLTSYPWMYEDAESNKEVYIENNYQQNILNDVFRYSYPAYFDIKYAQDDTLKPYELLVDVELDTQEAQAIATAIQDGKQNLTYNYPNIQYYIEDTSTNKEISNIEDTTALKALTQGNASNSYAWYIVYTFDENGILQVPSYYESDATQSYLINRYQTTIKELFYNQPIQILSGNQTSNDNNATYQIYFNNLENRYEFKPIKNMSFVFAMDEGAMSALRQENGLDDMYSHIAYQDVMLPMFIAMSILIFIACCMKKISIDQSPFGVAILRKIPVEIHVILYSTFFTFIIGTSYLLLNNTMQNEHIFLLGGEVSSSIGFLFLWGVENFLYWFLYFFYAVCLSYLIKEFTVSHTWKDHMLCARCMRKIKRGISKCMGYIKEFDLSNEDDKRIFMALGVNFVILSFMMFFWGFGIFFLFIYSIVLFFMIQKYVQSIRKDYANLLDVTKHMANGDLENDIETNLGVFDDFKSNMVDIRKGFQNAVAEEVQSQRMKTELITNVSHDLKTPLTSIISYIDLLKKEDITEAERKKYLDTLDRNSIRLKHLIEDLFEVSKANSGNVQLDLMQMDICALMMQVQVELDDRLKKQKLQIKNTFSDEKIILELDPQKTYRILENLMNNVAKYAMKQTRVYVEISDYVSHIDIIIKNISATELNFDPEEITERFTRGDVSRNTEGSGLGLAIAKSFTELQSGKMSIQIDGDLFKVSLRFPKQIQ